jgi:hypothetical protein
MSQDRYAEDPVAYRADYSRLAQSLHLQSVRDETYGSVDPDVAKLVKKLIGPRPSKPSAEEVMEEALLLIDRARTELLDLGWKWVGWAPRRYRHPFRRREKRRLADFLAQILEPATVVLYFSARIESGEAFKLSDAVPPSPLRRKRQVPRQGAAPEEGDKEWAALYLQYLLSGKVSDERERWFMTWRRSDEVNYRVRYNLACMYSRLRDGPSLDRSLEQLRQAIASAKGRERQALVGWARKDPSLTPVLTKRKADFCKALSAATATDEVI